MIYIKRILPLSLLLCFGCQKTKFNTLLNPAYIRVFNSLNYLVTVMNKDQPQPFLTMIIDPETDGKGNITGGKTIGDFLDKRAPYAPPYPDNAGNTSYKNTEYPGSAKVLVGPILNGIDLSSWAQITSGTHRFVFYTRPINPTPFFQLAETDRQNKIVDTTVTLTAGDVYTMEILQSSVKDTVPMPITFYFRKEVFTTTPFDDQQLYVNFYNLSAQGYAAANPGISPAGYSSFGDASNTGAALGDTMNIYYSLFQPDAKYPVAAGAMPATNLIPGYNNRYLGTLIRSQSSGVAPYYSIPLFAAPDTTGGILSQEWELFTFLRPDLFPQPGLLAAPGSLDQANPLFGAVGCSNISADGKGSYGAAPRDYNNDWLASEWLPNLIKYTASGPYIQRSFSSISSIEIINNQAYLMSVQRTYAPPNN